MLENGNPGGGPKILSKTACQDLVLQYLFLSLSDVQMQQHHQGKSRKYRRLGQPSLDVSRLKRAYSAGEAWMVKGAAAASASSQVSQTGTGIMMTLRFPITASPRQI